MTQEAIEFYKPACTVDFEKTFGKVRLKEGTTESRNTLGNYKISLKTYTGEMKALSTLILYVLHLCIIYFISL